MNARAAFFKVVNNRAFVVEWMNQFNAGAINRKECRRCFCWDNAFRTLILESKVIEKALDCAFKIWNSDSDMV